MGCVRCGGVNLVYAGWRPVWNVPDRVRQRFRSKAEAQIKKQRLKCKDCKHVFVYRSETYHGRYRSKLRQEIVSLSKRKKGFVNVHDPLKKVTFSTREIALKLGVSKTYVHTVVQDHRKKWKMSYGSSKSGE